MIKNLHLFVVIFLATAFFSNSLLKASMVSDEELTAKLTQDEALINLEEIGSLDAKKDHLPNQSISQTSRDEVATADIDSSINNNQMNCGSIVVSIAAFVIFALIITMCVGLSYVCYKRLTIV